MILYPQGGGKKHQKENCSKGAGKEAKASGKLIPGSAVSPRPPMLWRI